MFVLASGCLFVLLCLFHVEMSNNPGRTTVREDVSEGQAQTWRLWGRGFARVGYLCMVCCDVMKKEPDRPTAGDWDDRVRPKS